MNLRKFILIGIFAGTLYTYPEIHAQETLKITIEELFLCIEQSNTEVRASKKNVDIARQNENSAEYGRLPDLEFSASANYLGNGIVMERDFSNPSISPMPHFGNGISLSLYQPIYSGGEIKANIEKAKYNTQLSVTGLEAVTDRIKIEALECYLSLLKYRNLLNVYDRNIKLAEELLDEMKARSEQGIALANDVTRYELTLSNLNYDRLTIANAIEHLNYNLTVYLGLSPETIIETAVDLQKSDIPYTGPDIWKHLALEYSPELKKLEIKHSMSFSEQKTVLGRMLPKIGLTAGDNLEGPITSRSPVLNSNLNTWWVGLSISFDISSLYKERGNLKATKLHTSRLVDERQAMEESINRQIDKIYRQYIEAREQIRTQLKNVELATENYRIVERRYSADLSLLTDMLDASASRLEAETRLVNAQINVIFYYFQLKYISGNI